MNLRLVIDSGKNFKRRSNGMWLKTLDNGTVVTVEAMLTYHIGADDILADDWEIEEDKPTSLELNCWSGTDLTLEKHTDILISMRYPFAGDYDPSMYLEEKDIDKILTFLYNNTEIGKSRITPF
jgi:hypothetical protein